MTQLDAAAHRTAIVEALGVLGSGPEERFDRITRMTQEAFGVPLTFLNLVHHDVVTAQSTQGWRQGGSAPAEQVFCSTTVLADEPMVVPDAMLDPRFAHLAAVTEQGIRFYAGAPLSMLDGTRVGTLCIMDAQPRELSAEDVELLRDLARWAERELGHSIERDRVRRVLEGLAPERVEVPGYALDTVFVQPGAGGGDVADWRVAADGTLHLSVGTVVAGRASALLAAAVRGAVIARTDVASDVAFAGLEAQLAPDVSAAGAVVTLVHARVDPASGRVDLVDAGHGLAAVVRGDGGLESLASTDLPLGLQPTGVPRAARSIVLGPGDSLVLCSDGAVALDGVDDLGTLASAATEHADGLRAVLPSGDPATDVTAAVLTRR